MEENDGDIVEEDSSAARLRLEGPSCHPCKHLQCATNGPDQNNFTETVP